MNARTDTNMRSGHCLFELPVSARGRGPTSDGSRREKRSDRLIFDLVRMWRIERKGEMAWKSAGFTERIGIIVKNHAASIGRGGLPSMRIPPSLFFRKKEGQGVNRGGAGLFSIFGL